MCGPAASTVSAAAVAAATKASVNAEEATRCLAELELSAQGQSLESADVDGFLEAEDGKKVLSSLAKLLHARIAAGMDKKQKATKFDVDSPPLISLGDYLARLSDCLECGPACFVTAFIYISRFTEATPKTFISYYNAHRLIITSVVLAQKFYDDECYANKAYAMVGGVCSAKQLTEFEMHFLQKINWKVSVTKEEFNACVEEIRGDPKPQQPQQQQQPQLQQQPLKTETKQRTVTAMKASAVAQHGG
jgi:hypothetical protein